MKVGWHTYSWSEFFEVLDIAGRGGSGVGSFGVERYYILLNGVDGSLGEEGVDGSAVILDVKMEPDGAVRHVLSDDEKAWYDIMVCQFELSSFHCLPCTLTLICELFVPV